jgi:rsbT antagonist protein RsbS
VSDHDADLGPPRVSILSQSRYLIVSIHTALDDGELLRLERDLLDRVDAERARGIVIDISVLDVLDSFATHTLGRIEAAARLKGARTVVVGITPEVAMAVVCLSLHARLTETALDLEEGLLLLASKATPEEAPGIRATP